MDVIDQKILSELATDARLTSEKLGDRVGLSPSAAHRRVKQLEEAGYILGYGARLSRAARGEPATIFVSVTLVDQRRETMERFEAAIREQPLVTEAHLMSGEYDYLLKAEVPASDSFERIHRDVLAALPGVHRLVTHFSIRGVIAAV
ncbi:MAG: Lrp/AsnC family transcriptional regulator [Alphaproteobacteria bacterium]|nr:Lrp/AsnC family transcriptional regulator [Alphaproteobacteria bacterium]